MLEQKQSMLGKPVPQPQCIMESCVSAVSAPVDVKLINKTSTRWENTLDTREKADSTDTTMSFTHSSRSCQRTFEADARLLKWASTVCSMVAEPVDTRDLSRPSEHVTFINMSNIFFTQVTLLLGQ